MPMNNLLCRIGGNICINMQTFESNAFVRYNGVNVVCAAFCES